MFPRHFRLGRVLAALSLGNLIAALYVAITGGYSVHFGGIRLSSHNVRRHLAIGLLSAALGLLYERKTLRHSGLRWPEPPRWFWPIVALLVSVAVIAVGIMRGTFCAIGADGYGYVSQSALWASGHVVVDQPIARAVPWPNADWTFSPLGYRPAKVPGSIVPTYAPGLPLVMAALRRIGHDEAVYLAVPLLGALAVFATFLIGRVMDGHVVGICAALFLATSPIFLFQLVQPMSDVAVTGWWAISIALLLQRTCRFFSFVAGLTASMALLTRPNLLLMVPACVLLLTIAARTVHARSLVTTISHCVSFLAGVSPGIVAVAMINARLYGSPLESGYGPLNQIFASTNLVPNLWRYPMWLYQLHGPVVVLAVLSPALLHLKASAATTASGIVRYRSLIWAALAVVGSVWASYLLYIPFEDWPSARFMLPALPLLFICAAISIVRLCRLLPVYITNIALTLATTSVALTFIQTARDVGAFNLFRAERRVIEMAAIVSDHTPRDSIIICLYHSGSLRQYAIG